ncbi:MAG TPA: L,D-transpeptidase [Gemmatimonadaceae bacterium]|nr:L,D-transpeptidase [Gemmatimonadaceae bacterium]
MHAIFRRALSVLPILVLTASTACASAQASTDTTVRRDTRVAGATGPGTAAPGTAAPAASTTAAPPAASSTIHAAHAVEASAKPAGDRPRPGAGLRLEADLSQRKLHLYEGGQLVRSYDVAIGKDDNPTPRGSFSVRKLVWNPGWVPPDEKWARKKSAKAPGEKGNPMKVVKIFFREPDYYIHGTGETHTLGTKASHGCLRMAPSDAAEVGQYVMEHGGQPRNEIWFKRIFRFRSKSQVVYLRNPVPLTVTG